MEIKEMQEEAFKLIEDYNNKNGLEHNKDTTILHLIEEVGELSREIYNERNDWRGEFDREKLELELIDVLYQLLVLSKDYDINLEELFKKKLNIWRRRFELD